MSRQCGHPREVPLCLLAAASVHDGTRTGCNSDEACNQGALNTGGAGGSQRLAGDRVATLTLVDGFGHGLGGGLRAVNRRGEACLLYTSPSPRDATLSRMPSSA